MTTLQKIQDIEAERPDEEKIKKVGKKSNNNVFDLTTSDEEDVVQTSVVTSSYRQEVFSKFFNNAKEIEHDIEGFHKQYPQATSGLLTTIAIVSLSPSLRDNVLLHSPCSSCLSTSD